MTAKRQTYRRLIGNMRWLRLRRAVLSAHPFCQRCEERGRLAAATEVHHVVPCETATNPREMESLMYDPHNLMPLCHRCHVEVHEQMGKGGRQERERRKEAEAERFRKRFFNDFSK